MGGSVGIHANQTPQSPYDKEFHALFIDSTILEGEAALRKDASMRKSFVDFIKGGSWTDKLIQFENAVSGLEMNDETPTWTRFGYDCPSERPRGRAMSEWSESSNLSSTSSRKAEHAVVSREKSLARTTIRECCTAVSNWTLFPEKQQLRGVLLVALYPLYVQSAEYKRWKQPKGSKQSPVASCENSTYSSPARRVRKAERLRSLLVGTAALFDSTELEASLADPKASMIRDFQMAITNLPVQVMVCVTNREQRQSRVVYSNVKRASDTVTIPENEELQSTPTVPKKPLLAIRTSFGLSGSNKDEAGTCDTATISGGGSGRLSDSTPNSPVEPCAFAFPGSSRSFRLSPTKGSPSSTATQLSDKVGKNLLDLHRPGNTTETIKQMERALYNTHYYKQRFVRPNGDYHLRAFKPVFSPMGAYICTLSVDAFGTIDPATCPDVRYVPERRFQEVDDVLALLPLFIKG